MTQAMQSAAQCVRDASRRLRDHGIATIDPAHHAGLLIRSVLGWNQIEYALRAHELLDTKQTLTIEEALLRRLDGVPLQYIRGWEAFWSGEFLVGPGVLIPRPETEILVEALLDRLPASSSLNAIELGPGTGAIGISVLLERPTWHWTAIEISDDAAKFLSANLSKHSGVASRYRFEIGDFFDLTRPGEFDLLVANPPYIATSQITSLPIEVRHEPRVALDGGEHGLDYIRRLAGWASANIRSGGLVFIEIGDQQGPATFEIFRSSGLSNVEILEDLCGRARVAIGHIEDRSDGSISSTRAC